MKLAKSGINPKEIKALFESMGSDVRMGEVEQTGYKKAFTHAEQAAALSGSKPMQSKKS